MFKVHKNMCKVCNQYVRNNTGTQCQGICHGWVHFDCLHLTSDKINDIKSGVISLVCPCPTCKNPKESLYLKSALNNKQKQKPADWKEVAIDTRCPPQVQASKCEEAVQLSKEKYEQAEIIKECKAPQFLKPQPCKEPKDKNNECGAQVDLAWRSQLPSRESKGQKYAANKTPQHRKCAPPLIEPQSRKRPEAQLPFPSDGSGICKMCGHKLGKTVSKGSKDCKALQITSQDFHACEPESKVNTDIYKTKIGKPVPPELCSKTQTSCDSTKGKEKSCQLKAKLRSHKVLSDSDCGIMKSTAINTSLTSVCNVDKMCKEVGELTDQIHQLMAKMRETVNQREHNYRKKIEHIKKQSLACACTDVI